jgi:hypothetical protein
MTMTRDTTIEQALRMYREPGFGDTEPLPIGTMDVDDLSSGMVVGWPRQKLPASSFRSIINGRVREDGVRRRPGTDEWLTKPNSNPVLKIGTFFKDDGNYSLVRFDQESIYADRGHGSWEEITTSGPDPITGELQKVSFAQLPYGGEDYIFFANGAGPIRYIQLVSDVRYDTWDPIVGFGAQYVASFADRLVYAKDVEFGWSANGNPFGPDDASAGVEFLIQDGGFSNPVTGLFGLVNECIMLRRRSIWHISRNPFETAPFRFTLVVKDQGCDLPSSAVQAGNAVIFADHRMKGVFIYQPGSPPQRISQQIDSELFEALQNLKWAEGAWDPFEEEYHLGLSTTASDLWLTKRWVWSRKTNSWSSDDSPEVSSLGVVVLPGGRVVIDDLVGKIDALVGTIDELGGGATLNSPTMMFGTPTGEVIQMSYAFDTDWDGSAFEFCIESQNLGASHDRRTLMEVLFKVKVTVVGELRIDNSNDGETWRNQKTFTSLITAMKKVRNNHQVTGDDLYFRLRSLSSDVNVIGYWVRILEKGKQFG